MTKLRMKLTACAFAAGFLIASGLSAQAQTVIYTDNFNIPDTASLDGSDQTGRHTGLLATNIVGRSGGIQNGITNGQLQLLRVSGGDAGRMRFHSATNTADRWDWASGAAGAQILADGGMKISFDWTAADNTLADWISFCVGIVTNTDPALRVVDGGTDSGILMRNNGGAQVFNLGTGGAIGAFDVTSLTRHVDLNYAFSSWADGAAVTLNGYVDGNLFISQTFSWNGNSGVHHMEIASLAAGTQIDNFSVTSFAPPPFISVSAVSDSPASVYAGRTVNFIGTVAGTQPITNQWKVDKGSGFTNVSALATNATLTLTNVHPSDSGTYQLFSSNVAGPADSGPIPLTVLAATTSDSFNVQFTGSWLGSGNAPTQTGPAVIGNDGDTWNPISNPTGGTSPAGQAVANNLNLVDALNVGTTVTMNYVGDYVFNGRAFGASGPFFDNGSPYASLMTGYMGSVSNGGQPDTNRITIHNLKPGSYELYLYSSSRTDGQARLAVFTANGQTASCGPNSGNFVLIAGTNYVQLTPTVGVDGLLNISFHGLSGADAGQSQLNGFQLHGPVTASSLFLSSDTTSDSPPTNYAGRTVTLAASFSGNPTPALLWKVNRGTGFTNVSASATNSSLVLANVQTSTSGSYSLFATNVVGVSNSTPVALTVLAAPNSNFGVKVNVQFVGTSRGTAFAATQTGPAVIGNAGDFWNPVSNPNPVLPDTSPISGNGLILSDAAGIGTTLTLDYTANADLNTAFANPFFSFGSPAENLMQAFLAAENTNTATVTLHGLLPGAYDLYLYSSAGNLAQDNVSQFTANGQPGTVGPNSANSVLTADVNYAHLTPTVTGNGLLNISLVGNTNGLAQLNGFQVSGPGAVTLYVILDIQRNGAQLTLTWPNGTLLESTSVLGPWTTNLATSPFTFTPSPSSSQKFYRARVQ